MEGERLSLLIVDDDVSLNTVYARYLSQDFFVDQAYTTIEAQKYITEKDYHIILLDIGLGKDTNAGFELLSRIRHAQSHAHVVMLSGRDDAETIQHALSRGAVDFVSKAHPDQDIIQRIKIIAEHSTSEKESSGDRVSILGNSFITEDPRLLTILGNLYYLRDNTHITILIEGESGVGKELIARYIHDLGNPHRPFIVVNCAAIPDALMESVLFGHKKGSFTGATEDRIGKFELAHEGDVFLDEVGTLSLDTQKKLLRVLQGGEVERIGSHHIRQVNCRIISATNENLEELVRAKRFRLDLYHRLKGMSVLIPPLRERRGDIDLLLDHFIQNTRVLLTEEVRKVLRAYSWPGNVRELENCIKLVTAMKRDGLITPRDIPSQLYTETFPHSKTGNLAQELLTKAKTMGLKSVLENIEKEIIECALHETKTQSSCAELLKTSAPTLTRKIKDYGLK